MTDPTAVAEIFKLIDEYREALHAVAVAESHDFTTYDEEAEAEALAARINAAVNALHAAGVTEGRRQRDEEIRDQVFASARAAAEAGFGPVPESVTVTYTPYERGNDCPTCGGTWDDRDRD